ncbi:MAG: hypothetical protein Q8R29_02000 [bacterium]|nr:hypothetical protein [bacterium]
MPKNHHKLGNRKGMPAYRTPSGFKYKKSIQKQVSGLKNYPKNLRASRWEGKTKRSK